MSLIPNKKVNILHLITGLDPGGAERVVFDLCRNSSSNRFNVFTISLSKKKVLLNKFIAYKINTQSLKMEKTLINFIQAFSYLIKFTKKERIKIIHAHMIHAMIMASLIKIFNKDIKIVFTSHNVKFGSKFRKFLIYIFKPFRNVDILFSENLKKFYYRRSASVVIPNGIDLMAYNIKVSKYDIYTFIAIGRLEYVKNHSLLIDVAEKLKGNFEFKILIVGEGELRSELETKINEKGLTGQVSLLGFRNNIAELLSKSHVFVMPSLWEGLPISLLEAGASGLPILSTPVGNIPSLINENNGYLSDKNNFADKMYYIYKHYNEALVKASELRKLIVEKHTISKVVSEHEKIYSSLASQ